MIETLERTTKNFVARGSSFSIYTTSGVLSAVTLRFNEDHAVIPTASIPKVIEALQSIYSKLMLAADERKVEANNYQQRGGK